MSAQNKSAHQTYLVFCVRRLVGKLQKKAKKIRRTPAVLQEMYLFVRVFIVVKAVRHWKVSRVKCEETLNKII